jgi:hypothetical protein
MLVSGDLKCLHCGHTSGHWVGPRGAPLAAGGQPPASPTRCGRCQGPVYLDDVTPVATAFRLRRIQRMRQQLAASSSPPPGRGRAA